MILMNSIILFLADFGMTLCTLIGLFMINSQLGAIATGLYVIKNVAELLIVKEQERQWKEMLDKAEKL